MLKPKTKRILEFIERYTLSNHETPTMAEIGKQFGMSSPASVYKHVVVLESEGLITRKPHAWRCIRLVSEVQKAA